MKYCEDHGDSIVVWEGRGDCPVCREIDDLKGKIEDLGEQVDKLQEEVDAHE